MRNTKQNETTGRDGTMVTKSDHNKIKNALVKTYGIDGYKEAFERCQTSKRFGTLEAIANHDSDEAFEWLIRASAKIAENPKTKAQLR